MQQNVPGLPQEKRLYPQRWTMPYFAVCFVLVTGLLVGYVLNVEQPAWGSWPFIVAALVWVGLLVAMADLKACYIGLRGVDMVEKSLFIRRRFDKAAISDVHWSKGCPVVLTLADGQTHALPGVYDSQASAAAIRAWLKQK